MKNREAYEAVERELYRKRDVLKEGGLTGTEKIAYRKMEDCR